MLHITAVFRTSLVPFLIYFVTFEKLHITLPSCAILNFIVCCFYFISVHSLNHIDILVLILERAGRTNWKTR